MKKNRRIQNCLFALLLLSAVILSYPVNEVHAATTTLHTDMKAASSVDILKVSKATNSAAKKIDKILSEGKPLDIKIKGTKKQATKIIKELKEKIKYVNKQAVIFQGSMHSDKNGYIIYSIDENQATDYKYAVKFVEKVFQQTKDNLYGVRAYYEDVKLFEGDQDTMFLRWAYEYLLDKKLEIRKHGSHMPQELRSLFIANVQLSPRYINSSYILENQILHDLFYDSNQLLPLSEVTFERFKSLDNVKEFAEDAGKEWMKNVLTEPDKLLCTAKSFCELSDAMKVYAIDRSTYFGTNYDKFTEYLDTANFMYNTDSEYYMAYSSGIARASMKDLYEGNAIGVCDNFANAECKLWNSLGLANTKAISRYLDHAWSIVKVKNSKGKTLFIPFDYGIGPNCCLDLPSSCDFYQKYDTDDKQYEYYLQAMKGAPKKRALFLSDFN